MFKKSSTFLSILDGDWKSNLLLLKQIMQPIKTAETHKKKQLFTCSTYHPCSDLVLKTVARILHNEPPKL
jgi:hypothetical protein